MTMIPCHIDHQSNGVKLCIQAIGTFAVRSFFFGKNVKSFAACRTPDDKFKACEGERVKVNYGSSG